MPLSTSSGHPRFACCCSGSRLKMLTKNVIVWMFSSRTVYPFIVWISNPEYPFFAYQGKKRVLFFYLSVYLRGCIRLQLRDMLVWLLKKNNCTLFESIAAYLSTSRCWSDWNSERIFECLQIVCITAGVCWGHGIYQLRDKSQIVVVQCSQNSIVSGPAVHEIMFTGWTYPLVFFSEIPVRSPRTLFFHYLEKIRLDQSIQYLVFF